MNEHRDDKRIRDARSAARRMARTTPGLSYQQALERVARDSGHANWNAMVASLGQEARHVRTVETVEPARRRSLVDRLERSTRAEGAWNAMRVFDMSFCTLQAASTIGLSVLLGLFVLREEFGPIEKPVLLVVTAALLAFTIVITVLIGAYAARGAAIWRRTRGGTRGGSTAIA